MLRIRHIVQTDLVKDFGAQFRRWGRASYLAVSCVFYRMEKALEFIC